MIQFREYLKKTVTLLKKFKSFKVVIGDSQIKICQTTYFAIRFIKKLPFLTEIMNILDLNISGIPYGLATVFSSLDRLQNQERNILDPFAGSPILKEKRIKVLLCVS